MSESQKTSRAERLKEARFKAGWPSARSAAIAHNWTVSTYGAHENGTNDFDDEQASRYARAFRVDPIWLLTGTSSRSVVLQSVPLIGYVTAGASLQLFDSSQGPFDEVQPPPYRTDRTVAAEVRGDSMRGLANDRWVIYWDDVRAPVTDDLIGELCIVWLEDGQALIKEVFHGTGPGLFHLESTNAPTLRDVPVASAAIVTAIVPRAVVRRHDRRKAS